VLRSYLAGLGTSNNATTPNTKIDVAAGQCVDSGNAIMLTYAGGTLDCGTTGANGLDAGTLANNTWYHAHIIGKADGTTALLACTTANLGSITMPSGYTLKRRIGSFKTNGSAQIIAYVQDGDFFWWSSLVADVNVTNPGTSAVTRTLTVPTGVNVLAYLQAGGVNGDSSGLGAYFSDLATTDTTPVMDTTAPLSDIGAAAIAPGGAAAQLNRIHVRTNTSAQIRSRVNYSSANVRLIINTLGWVDRRGKES
jgi:FlaG/FlaF family flagellin (archaellin)